MPARLVPFDKSTVNHFRLLQVTLYERQTLKRCLVSALPMAETLSFIEHDRGPVLWNALIFKDKNFSTISYKDLKRKTRSMDIFKELTFKETSTTTTNFRRKDFDYI